MRRIGLWCLLLAWAAMLLPWERCASECHDRLLPAVGEHACHAHGCGGEDAPERDNHEGDGNADHTEVRFESVVLADGVALPVPALGPELADEASVVGVTQQAGPIRKRATVPRTDVLLL